jgi:monooxygenase
MPPSPPDHVDVLIVGAGISGVGAAAHLADALPARTFAILERREAIGGTWDLFRYPGIRSDSDMHTLGYRFRPWRDDQVLADGPGIKRYVEETAAEYGLTERIRFGHRVGRACWDSDAARWTVEYQTPDGTGTLTTDFLWNCTGYYDYDEPYRPAFPGEDDFAGVLVHPQHWPEDLDCTGKKVVVIGSGATAVTLVPALAERAAHVTMLQRSPSYILSIPSRDPMGARLGRLLPEPVAAGVTRWRNVTMQAGLYQASRRRPDWIRKVIRTATERQLPEGYDVDTHFNPTYDPWDQRMCMVPNGDLFRAIRHGDASVATGHIERFEADGIRLTDGQFLEADVVVTATGLSLLVFGGMEIVVDGEPVKVNEAMAYKGLMLGGVPNFAYVIGYTNASWTLKADLVSQWVVRLLRTMERKKARSVVPVTDPGVRAVPLMGLRSGYVERALDRLPVAGDRGPWRTPQNYFFDVVRLRAGRVVDEALRFSR